MFRGTVLLVAALAALASCTRATNGTNGAGGPAQANPWTVHGVLRIAGPQDPDNLNTLLGTELVDTDLSMFWALSYEKGAKIVFVANERYWRGRPKLGRIEYSIVPNDNTMLALLASHQIDVFYRAPETMAASLRGIQGTRVSLTPFTRFADLGLNAGVPALRDRRVRQALAYATDRKALVEKVTHGIAIPGDTDQPPFLWAYDSRAKHYPYDPQRAMTLLEQAGWVARANGLREKDGEPLRLTLAGFTGSATASAAQVLVQAQWRRVGADVAIKNYPSGQLYATLGAGGIEQSGKFDVVFENWANGTDPDDAILFACAMAPPAGWNIYHFCSPALDEAERTALASYDVRVRREAYARVQEIAAEELPIIVLWYQQQFDVLNTDLHNYKPAHAVTPFWNTWEWEI